MRGSLLLITLLASVSFGLMATAQETSEVATDDTASADATATEAQPETASEDGDLSLGEPAGPQVGELYVRDTFRDWAVRCVKAPEGQADECNMYQLLQNAEGVAVSEVNLFPLAPGQTAVAGATIVVPLETLLTQQLTLAIDGRLPRRYPFAFCNRTGCVARMGFTQDEVDSMKSGSSAAVTIVPAVAPDQTVEVQMSLAGFTAAFDALSAEQ